MGKVTLEIVVGDIKITVVTKVSGSIGIMTEIEHCKISKEYRNDSLRGLLSMLELKELVKSNIDDANEIHASKSFKKKIKKLGVEV